MTFGYYRAGVLAAFINAVTLVLITLWIFWEAYGRFRSPELVNVVVDAKMTIEKMQNLLRAVEHKLVHLGIGHVTIQPEDKNHPHDEAVLCGNDCSQGHKH